MLHAIGGFSPKLAGKSSAEVGWPSVTWSRLPKGTPVELTVRKALD